MKDSRFAFYGAIILFAAVLFIWLVWRGLLSKFWSWPFGLILASVAAVLFYWFLVPKSSR